jgi:hypothetical protein
MLEIIAFAAFIAAWIWWKRAARSYRIRRTERQRQKALQNRRIVRTAATWVLRRALRRRFLWRPPQGRTAMNIPCPVARRGIWRTVGVRVDQHLLVAGLTGSGKSSTARVLADWAIRSGAKLILIDLKPNQPEGQLYAGRATVITSASDVVTLVRKLLAEPQPCVIIVDEMATLVRALSAKQLDEFASLMDQARVFKIQIWMCVQHPSRETVPSMLQSNVGAVLCHRVRTKVEADVVFHDPDWRPDQLRTPGDLLIQEGKHAPGRLSALWLSPEVFKALPIGGPIPLFEAVTAPVPAITEVRPTGLTAPPPGEVTLPIGGVTTPPVELTDNQQLACLALELAEEPLTARAITEATGLPQNRTADALKALTAKGVVSKDPDAYPALYELAPAAKELDR